MLKRDDVIRIVASLVTREGEYPHRVNFDEPELVVIVEIIRVSVIYTLTAWLDKDL